MIYLSSHAQVLRLAAYVRDIQHDPPGKLSLKPERILLNGRNFPVPLVKALGITHARQQTRRIAKRQKYTVGVRNSRVEITRWGIAGISRITGSESSVLRPGRVSTEF